MYSLRMSFWVVPAIRSAGDALLLGRGHVQGQQDRRRGVDRHRGADLAERQAVEQDLHVGEAGDRDADPADLAFGLGGVGVVAHLGRQVERDRQPGLALLEEVAEPLVRLLGGREAGVLAHRPEAAPVHRRLDAAGEGRLAGQAEVALLVEAGRGQRRPRCRGRRSRGPRSSRSGRAARRRSATPCARVVARQRLADRFRSSGRPRSSPAPRPAFVAHRSTTSRSPSSIVSGRRRPRPARRSRLAAPGARSASSSPRRRGAPCPASTASPAATRTAATRPGMIARISVGPLAAAASARAVARRRSAARPSSSTSSSKRQPSTNLHLDRPATVGEPGRTGRP